MALSTPAIRLSVLGVVILGVVAFKVVAGNSVEKKLNKIIEKSHNSWSYKSASVDLFGGDIHVDGIKIKSAQDNLKIDEVVIHSYDKENEFPQYMNFEVNGIHITKEFLSQTRQLAKTVESLGYKNLEANVAINYKINKEKKLFALKELSLAVGNVGKMDLAVDLYGIDNINQLLFVAMMPQLVKIGKSSLSYEDDSLVNRLIKEDGKRRGISFAENKKRLLSDIQKNIDKYKRKQDIQKVNFLEQMYKFIESPKAIKISINPSSPLSLGVAQKLSDKELKERLKLKISAE